MTSDATAFTVRVTREELCAFLVDDFCAEFKTEEDGFEEIFRRLNEEHAIRCSHCGSVDLKKEYGSRTVYCRSCKRRTWFTAGTFFERIRSALLWLLPIYLMERGIVLSAAELSRLANVASSTAQATIKKILFVAKTKMSSVPAEEMYSSEFIAVVCKRSRETPAGAHPKNEEEEMEKRALNKDASAQLFETKEDDIPVELDDLQKEIYDLLSDEPIHIDQLCARTGQPFEDISRATMQLEWSGFAHYKPGGWYVRNSKQENKPGSEDKVRQFVAATIMSFISDIFHGISRKYLQLYLAAYWCSIDRSTWYATSLIKECCRAGPIAYREIVKYVSPLSVCVIA